MTTAHRTVVTTGVAGPIGAAYHAAVGLAVSVARRAVSVGLAVAALAVAARTEGVEDY